MPEQPTDGARHVDALPQLPWKGARLLQLVRDWNAHCLRTLALHACRGADGDTFQVIRHHLDLWRQLDESACRLGGQTPFLLVDLNFACERWWCGPQKGRSTPVTPHRGAPKITAALTREALALAWLATVCDRRTATILFGMAPAVAALISALGPHDVDRLAEQRASELKLRWETHPTFWRMLLRAAISADAPTLNDLHLHGLQLLGSEVIHSSTENTFSRA